MRSRDVSWLALAATCWSVACHAVRDFREATNGGDASGGDASGGDASGGDASGGDASGGDASGGDANGGGNSGSAGTDGPGNAGQTADPDGGTPSELPVRIGFSVFHDSASGHDLASAELPDATFVKPEGTARGDFLLVFFGADHSLQHMTGPDLAATGWTLLDQHVEYGTDGQAAYLIYKVADASEPDPIVFQDINPEGGGVGVQGLLSVYRGVSSESPINAYASLVEPTGTDTTTRVTTATPAVTTTVAGCLAIAGLSPDTEIDAPVVSSWPEGFQDNRVSVNNPPYPYPNGWANIYAAERRLPEAGEVPASAFEWEITYGGMQYDGSLSFVLALAP
jgi:hypothetical protein